MTKQGIQPGAFVWYNHLGTPGIGKVEEAGDNLLVKFWNGRVERKKAADLTQLPDARPVALLWDKSKELEPWAKEKPLKLVALALSIDGGGGNANSIKEKLEHLAPLNRDWKTWWSQRAKSLNAFSALPEPQHFAKSARGSEYTLLCSIEAVPDDARPPVSLDDWKKWLLSDVKMPTFGKNPSKILSEALAEWPEDTIERVLNRTLWGAGLLLGSSKKPSAAAALAWMDAVCSAALRWSALYPDSHQLAERSGDVLSRLSQYIQVKRKEATLFRAGILSEDPDRERQLEQQRQEHERQCAEYESRLERQRQERERQRADYEESLERQRREQERQRASHAVEVEGLRLSHAAELERERREQERLQDRVKALSDQMASGREESRLEVRQSMLLAVGDALQRAYLQGKSAEDRLSNVITTLPKALQEGEAEILGTVGATVKYDPKLHHSTDAIPSGVKVCLTAPGVVVGDRVILKASVSTETEVC